MSVSLKRKEHESARFVRAIVLVKGIHFYGFQTGYAPFLKIHMIHPDKVSRAILILQSGSIMGTRINVFEGHLSYPLQFLCDFNLYGCSWIEVDNPQFRRSPYEEDDEGKTITTMIVLFRDLIFSSR
jgi:DNA polymerase zeta